MADVSETQLDNTTGEVINSTEDSLAALTAAGFTPAEVARLQATRERAQAGSLNEWTGDFKRLRFARWLYEQGRLES